VSPDPGPRDDLHQPGGPGEMRTAADERAVLDVFRSAARRSRIAAIGEGLAWGVAAAAFSLIAAPFVAALVIAWRLRATARPAIVRAIERTHPDARNLFVTADELLRGDLAAKPAVRERVLSRAALESKTLNLRALTPRRSFTRGWLVAAAAWLLVWTYGVWRPPVERLARRAGVPITGRSPSSQTTMRIAVLLTPPAYTGIVSTTVTDPAQIAAVEGTVATFSIDGTATRVVVEHEGATSTLTRGADGRFVDRMALKKTGYYAVEFDTGSRRVIPIVVSPDTLPAVTVTAPGRDLVFPVGDRRVDFEVHATDDFGLRALRLEYTKVSGSGEQFEFQEGRIPLTLNKAGDRDWRGRATQSLTGLDLKEGDVLVYRAAATDARPGDGTGRSDAFFVEISKLAVAAGDAFTVPEEETRYALSQQMLIVKTERLERSRPTMTPEDFTEAAINLAVEQRMIRAEFVFMLGGEVEDEEVEAEQSSELQSGRLQNRGQRDLRAATVAMSQAEKLLTGAATREALTAERAAVAALQRAFAKDRYILRALGSRTELDMNRRLTGASPDSASLRYERQTVRPNRRAALLQDLLAGLGALKMASSAAATTLAREAVRIDAGSQALRKAAEDLQKLADTWPTLGSNARNAAIDSIASSVATEAAHSLSAPQAPVLFASPALAGGFADALRSGGRK
jgi:hypothetical protein